MQPILDAIAVDGACNNPAGGNIEYRGVWIRTGQELFRVGPLPHGSHNHAEFLAIVHALALLDQRGNTTIPVYSDSQTGRAWVSYRRCNSTLKLPEGCKLADLIQRAERWLQTHNYPNPVLKWETKQWGEIPSDFGRK